MDCGNATSFFSAAGIGDSTFSAFVSSFFFFSADAFGGSRLSVIAFDADAGFAGSFAFGKGFVNLDAAGAAGEAVFVGRAGMLDAAFAGALAVEEAGVLAGAEGVLIVVAVLALAGAALRALPDAAFAAVALAADVASGSTLRMHGSPKWRASRAERMRS